MKLRVLSHTHWDREWFLPAYLVREWLPPFFDSLEERLREGTTEHFVLDGQTILLEDAVKAAGGEALHRFRAIAEDPRVSVGPYYQQPDWNLVSPEALIRNIRFGMADAAALGGSMRCGWLMDNFGQISQCPQIHHSFGLSTVFMWRGLVLPPREVRSEYRWESPDGSAVTAVYLLDSYRNGMQLLADPTMTRRRVAALAERLAPFSPTGIGVVMNGYDQEMEPEGIAPLLAELRAGGMDIVQTSPDSLAAELAAALEDPALPPLPVVRGEQYDGRYICVFPGVLSARSYLKLKNYGVETELERYAEPLAVLARLAGGRDLSRDLEHVWRRILRNHPHDSICGVSVDAVHRIMEERFDRIDGDLVEVEGEALRELLGSQGASSDTGEIFNPLPWERRVVIPGVDGVHTAAPLGWTAVAVAGAEPAGAEPAVAEPVAADTHNLSLTNGLITVQARGDGTITVVLHERTKEAHRGDERADIVFPGLLGLEDCGDTGDTYTWAPVPGEAPGPHSFPSGAPSPRDAHLPRITIDQESRWRAALEINRMLEVPAALTDDRHERDPRRVAVSVSFRVQVEAGSPVVTVYITVDNSARDHRLRLLVPHGTTSTEVLAGTPLDAVVRPAVPENYRDGEISPELQRLMLGAREPRPIRTLPFRDYLVCSGAARGGGTTPGCGTGEWQGLAVMAPGLFEYEHLEGEGALAITLLRAVGWLARPDVSTRTGDAGPLMATPEAQCIRRVSCTIAFVPLASPEDSARVPRHAAELRAPCRFYPGMTLRRTPFTDQLRTGLLALESTTGAVQLSALEYRRIDNRDTLELRLYNPGDTSEEVLLRWPPELVSPEGAAVTHLNGELRTDTQLVAEDATATRWRMVIPAHGIRQYRFRVARPSVWQQEEERAHDLRQEREHAAAAARRDGTMASRAHHSTVHRTLLEAEISAIMAGGGADGDERDEQALRRLGRELNSARIAKRTDDYLLALMHDGQTGDTAAVDQRAGEGHINANEADKNETSVDRRREEG